MSARSKTDHTLTKRLNIDPDQRNKEAINSGLMRCMEEQISIGFFIKRKPKPCLECEVLGLGFVKVWEDGYFTIEGINLNGENYRRY